MKKFLYAIFIASALVATTAACAAKRHKTQESKLQKNTSKKDILQDNTPRETTNPTAETAPTIEADSTAAENISDVEKGFGWERLRRIDVSYEIMQHLKSTWAAETIQPIYQTKDSLANSVFFQGQWAYRNLDNTINAGLGYRYLFKNQALLLGINGFYDNKLRYSHQRFSVGAEIISRYITLRANYYHPLSHKKNISFDNGIYNYDRALKGIDAELELPFPFLPWVRVAGDIFRWKSKTVGISDVTGNKFTIRSNLTKYLFLEFGLKNDSVLPAQKFVKFTLNLLGKTNNGVGATMTDGDTFSSHIFEERNLTDRTLDRVQRYNDIWLEQVR